MTDLNGRTAIVTGGARGIGEACARALAEAGARVIVADVLEAEGRSLAGELAGPAEFVRLDVTSADDWRGAVRAAIDGGGSLDVLVNSAGIIRPGTVEQQTEDDFRRIVEVNLTGTFLGMQAVLPEMRRQRRGAVVTCPARRPRSDP
jgi:3alpha(or 20beta)-hydroxysteroid dehydrogenase